MRSHRLFSSSVGRNSVPRNVALYSVSNSAVMAVAKTAIGRAMSLRSNGLYQRRIAAIKAGECGCSVLPKTNDVVAGTNVRLRTIDAIRAKPIVKAIGLKMMPSTPPMKNSGEYATMMMPVEKIIARCTSLVALMIASSSFSAPSSRCRMMFSITITAASTITPKSIAPSEIRLAGTWKCSMLMNDTHSASGITAATTAAARKLPKKTNNTASTSEIPTTSVCSTVPMVMSSSTWRS